jgi:hypothetical protein
MKIRITVFFSLVLLLGGSIGNTYALSAKTKGIAGASIATAGGIATWYTWNKINKYKEELAELKEDNASSEKIELLEGKLKRAKAFAILFVLTTVAGAGFGAYGLASRDPFQIIEGTIGDLCSAKRKCKGKIEIEVSGEDGAVSKHEVGILVNPKGPALRSKGGILQSKVLIIANHSLTLNVVDAIKKQIPDVLGHPSFLEREDFKGKPIFEAFGL